MQRSIDENSSAFLFITNNLVSRLFAESMKKKLRIFVSLSWSLVFVKHLWNLSFRLMGASQGSINTKKGVIYEKKTGEITDCLFCRIARGESPENQLWYQDDQCVVFIPRGPVAQLHLLVVSLEHIQNISTLTEKHQALLEHMQKV